MVELMIANINIIFSVISKGKTESFTAATQASFYERLIITSLYSSSLFILDNAETNQRL